MNQPERPVVYPARSSPLHVVGVLVFGVLIFSVLFSALAMIGWIGSELQAIFSFGGNQ
jgi:hypothetical protein